MIEVRFSTWIKAKSLEDAWEQLRVKLIEVRLGDKLREVFTPAVLEDGEIDNEEKFKKLAERVEPYAEKNKKSLYEELKKVANECQTREGCWSCPYLTPEGEEAYWACRAFGETPYDYNLDEIPEEYR